MIPEHPPNCQAVAFRNARMAVYVYLMLNVLQVARMPAPSLFALPFDRPTVIFAASAAGVVRAAANEYSGVLNKISY